ncbi:MAG: hypothetical protein HY921_06475 [Elusimicrobia bacterium]|nr:hypothetical protein [Elusimicrobiota bacterium]
MASTLRSSGRGLLAAAAFAAIGAASAGEAMPALQMINLSCLEALTSIDQAGLAGVFSFIAEEKTPEAFADLLVHDQKALKKFVKKVEKDFKEASAISTWDQQALQFALTVYGSPLAEALGKPAASVLAKLSDLSRAPAVSLGEMTERRRKGA